MAEPGEGGPEGETGEPSAEAAPAEPPPPPPLVKLGIVTREYERPWEMEITIFKECTPQAILRDLHRPEAAFTVGAGMLERIEVPGDGGCRWWREQHAEYFIRYIADVPALLHTHKDYLEGVAEHRAAMKQSWSKALKTVQEERAERSGANWQPQAWLPKEERDKPPEPPQPAPAKKLKFF